MQSDIDLGTLHQIIQSAMGWLDCHLHHFVAGRTLIGVADDSASDWGDGG